MRVLITGATGLVGRRLCKLLDEAGHELVALSRHPQSAKSQVRELQAAFPWQPAEGEPPAECLHGVDGVVHLAGETVAGRWTKKKQQKILDSRVAGTRHLVAALGRAKNQPTVLVSASAIGFYGDRDDELLTEGSRGGQDFLAGLCREWEEQAQAAQDLGVRVVRLRIGVVLAPGGGALAAMLLPFKLGAGGPLGSGRQWWSWVHRDDIAGMARLSLENPSLEGVFNATAPEPVPQREFARILGQVLRRPAFLPTPSFALKLALGGFSSELLSSKRVVPARFQEASYEYRHPDLEGALREALGK